jgi:glycosyltransferase involved in cell wall biosynthesis
MKVIYICAKSFFFTKGYRGRVIHAKGIVEGLLANGCDVEVVSGPKASNFLDKHENLTITSLGKERNNLLNEVLWRKKLLNYLNDSIEKFDLLILRYGFSNPILSLKIAKLTHKYNCQSTIEVNSLGSDHKNRIKLLRGLIRHLEVNILSHFDTVYVVSEEEKSRIEEVNNGLNIIVIPNATHNCLVASDSESDLVRFLYMGRLNHYYNFEEVIESFKAVRDTINKNIELIVYGYGANDALLVENAKRDPHIKMMGEYNNNKITNLVNRDTDILLLPYNDDKDDAIRSPIKLFEYLTLGAPILASNVGQINEIIRHKENGYIYSSGNTLDLMNKMIYLINHKEERKEIGLSAHKEAVEDHTWNKRMLKLLNSITESDSILDKEYSFTLSK